MPLFLAFLPPAFNHILGDVSLVVYQFEAIAGFSAVIDRLGEFREVLNDCRCAVPTVAGLCMSPCAHSRHTCVWHMQLPVLHPTRLLPAARCPPYVHREGGVIGPSELTASTDESAEKAAAAAARPAGLEGTVTIVDAPSASPSGHRTAPCSIVPCTVPFH